MSGTSLDLALLAGAVVVLAAVAAVQVSVRAGLPSLVLYLGIGMLIGEDGFGLSFGDTRLTRDVGLTALALILAEGGLTTRWRQIRASVPAAALLATVGIGVSVGVVAVAAHVVLGVGWQVATVLGAVVSSTDAAAVFAILRQLRLPRRLVGALEAESGFNDAPAVILVTALSSTTEAASVGSVAASLAYELAVGAAIGLVVGRLAALLLRRAALPVAGLYPLATLAFAITAYAAAASAHASGFLAVYLAALIVGNSRLPHRGTTLGFAEAVAWLAQIGLFVVLGLLASPDRLVHAIGPALAIGAVLLFVARPLSVLVSVSWFRIRLREQLFLSWAGLRGAVPIVLTTIPLDAGMADSQRLFDTVFVLVTVFTLVQAPTLPAMTRLLGVARPAETADIEVDAAPLDELDAELLQLAVPPGSRLNRVEMWELRLPAGAEVTLIVRDGRSFVPQRSTWLQYGDQLLVVSPRGVRDQTERRLRAVHRSGKLAGLYGDAGAEQ